MGRVVDSTLMMYCIQHRQGRLHQIAKYTCCIEFDANGRITIERLQNPTIQIPADSPAVATATENKCGNVFAMHT